MCKSGRIVRQAERLTALLGADTAGQETSADVMHMPLSGRSAVKG